MAKVIMICGKICSGKSFYAQQIRREQCGVILSADEITLALFGQDAEDKQDVYTAKLKSYLFEKSAELIAAGINVILDWGFWTKNERDFARAFYTNKNIKCEFHCIAISEKEWKKRLKKRNNSVESGKTNAYYVDEGLAKKVEAIFEIPSEDEIDVWVKQ